MIGGVRKIVVPVDDQDRALNFWKGRIGFKVVRDLPHGDGRWLEVSSDDGVILVLSPRPADEPLRERDPQLPHSPIFFGCADIRKTHAELVERGVSFPQPPVQMGFGWWALFEDCDGARYALGQW